MVVSLSSPLVTRSGHSAAVSSIALVVASIPLAGPRRVRPRPQPIPAIPPQRRQLSLHTNACTVITTSHWITNLGRYRSVQEDTPPVDTTTRTRLFNDRRGHQVPPLQTSWSKRILNDAFKIWWTVAPVSCDWRFAANRGILVQPRQYRDQWTHISTNAITYKSIVVGVNANHNTATQISSPPYRRRPSLPRRQDRRNDRIGVGGGGFGGGGL
jgi:hypothetical protein